MVKRKPFWLIALALIVLAEEGIAYFFDHTGAETVPPLEKLMPTFKHILGSIRVREENAKAFEAVKK